MSVSIRRARRDDLDFLVELYQDEDVRPFLAASGDYERDGIGNRIARADEDPDAGELLVVEDGGERAGAMAWERKNARSRIAHAGGLAVHPRFRGGRVADEAARLLQRYLIGELGYHRIELEVYGFNERGQRHAERSGWVREGVRRKAYLHGDEWVDGVLYALVAEDLGEWTRSGSVTPMTLLDEHVRRFNAGVRRGDFGPLVAGFAEDGELRFEGVLAGPFLGRAAIAQAYRDQPPDDEVEVLGAEERDGVLVARYAWKQNAGKQAGEMHLTPREGQIARLVVTFAEQAEGEQPAV
jgi:RimJ/RimL family protein N-acetyltransferase